MRKLFRYFSDFGRMSNLEGLFIATQAQVNEIIGKEIYFGEVLGKHSEVITVIEENEIEEISDDQDLINQLEKLFNSTTLCGCNPLDYYEDYNHDT
jgi:hypothetical protein